jgi:hypothetical protein
MPRWPEEYAKHSALNFGQALQGMRYLLTHPDMDRISPPGTMRHMLHAVPLRLKRIGNDLFFALLPPHWHHSADELATLQSMPVSEWFQAGYGPYRFSEHGGRLAGHEIVRDARWDPRCREDGL